MKPGTIEVIEDPAQVAAARKEYADQRRKRLQDLLSDPEKIGSSSHKGENLQLLGEDRERSVASLSQIRQDSSKPAIDLLPDWIARFQCCKRAGSVLASVNSTTKAF